MGFRVCFFFAKMKRIKIKKKNNNINYIITGFPTKNDQHLGCEMGVPPFKETPIYSPNHGDESNGRIPKKSTEETNPRRWHGRSLKKNKWRLPHFPTFLKMNEYPLNQLMVGSKIKWPPTRRSKGPFDVFEVAQQLVAPKTNPLSLTLSLFPSKKKAPSRFQKSLF